LSRLGQGRRSQAQKDRREERRYVAERKWVQMRVQICSS